MPRGNGARKRYSPAVCIGAHKNPIEGKPDPKYISTSYAEWQNLNVRMHTRRFTRLTNAFSNKLEAVKSAMKNIDGLISGKKSCLGLAIGFQASSTMKPIHRPCSCLFDQSL